MSVRRLDANQPASFRLTQDNLKWARVLVKKFPKERRASAVIPLLWRAQEQNDGWVSEPALRYVADFLDMPYIRVYEVATFYTMFNLSPVGKHYVQLCGTTPCWLRGADDLKAVCRKVIGDQNTVTKDGAFSWLEVECLGACVNAPMVQINADFYEDLTAENFEQLLMDLKAGKKVKPGPQNSRHSSEPEDGALTLIDPALYNGKAAPAAATKSAAKPRAAPKKAAPKAAPKKAKAKAPAAKAAASEAGKKPGGLKAARDGQADDLRQISGVGPKIEGLLHELGVFHFDQIAKWSEDNATWVDGYLKFKGRIARENWIEQAETLAAGGETEFSKRQSRKG
jgi:NADH-quinone oxidoreductase subunit E